MKQLLSYELRELYQQFFESKKHVRISSAPLVPENDSSVLFTTAGMHPLVPYLKGEPYPAGKRLCDVQKCLRTTDIDDVGDATHATVFEMLGNWSLGDYFKREAITFSWEFLTEGDWLGLDPHRLAVSVFGGDESCKRDNESAMIWREVGLPSERIAFLDKHENWWPAGGEAIGPQGPDSEMFYWTGARNSLPDELDLNDKRWVEIWNNVFMEFNRTQKGQYISLPQKNVDTGMGLERVVMVLNDMSSIYDIDTFRGIWQAVADEAQRADVRHMRIVADHIKAATFVMGDEHAVSPGKSEREYVVRRLMRRALRSARQLGIEKPLAVFIKGAQCVISEYGQAYPSLATQAQNIEDGWREETNKFARVLSQGTKKLEMLIAGGRAGDKISGQDAFYLYETYGFPIELTQEIVDESGRVVDLEGFEKALASHQSQSRKAAEGKFKGGLVDHSRMSVRYHTATHLLHQALRQVLGKEVRQKGSNITPERLRFDFSYDHKLTDEQMIKVESMVNRQIKLGLPVKREVMTVAQAKEHGAVGLFEKKYGDQVSMYSIGSFSKEICGGPHVKETSELGVFRIIKEESAGAGIRRIKATLNEHT